MPPIPLYEFACGCGHEAVEWRRIEDRHRAPKHCGRKMRRQISASRIAPDIQPYMTVACDKETRQPEWITSRKGHRDFVKRNGFEEVGSDSTIPRDALERIKEKRYVAGELDDSVNALP